MAYPAIFLQVNQTATVELTWSDRRTGTGLVPLAVSGAAIHPQAPTTPLSGRALDLGVGIYHVMSRGVVACKVLAGDCDVVIVFGGEDPWPTPPPQLAGLGANLYVALGRYLDGT
jgi:hypothetical protein